VEQHGQPHLELDEHFDSIEEAWAFPTHWIVSGDPLTIQTRRLALAWR
jgi:hypothetical protein